MSVGLRATKGRRKDIESKEDEKEEKQRSREEGRTKRKTTGCQCQFPLKSQIRLSSALSVLFSSQNSNSVSFNCTILASVLLFSFSLSVLCPSCSLSFVFSMYYLVPRATEEETRNTQNSEGRETKDEGRTKIFKSSFLGCFCILFWFWIRTGYGNCSCIRLNVFSFKKLTLDSSTSIVFCPLYGSIVYRDKLEIG